MAKLEDWSISSSSDNPKRINDKTILYGKIYNDERFPNGMRLRTGIDKISVSGGYVVTNSGSEFQLGKPSDEFVSLLAGLNHSVDEYEHEQEDVSYEQ